MDLVVVSGGVRRYTWLSSREMAKHCLLSAWKSYGKSSRYRSATATSQSSTKRAKTRPQESRHDAKVTSKYLPRFPILKRFYDVGSSKAGVQEA